MSRLMQPRRRRRAPVLLTFSFLMFVAGIGLFVMELFNFSQRENRLPANITVADVPVGGEFEDRAQAALEQAYAEPITLYYDGSPIVLNPDDVGFRVSSAAMIAEAMTAGEAGGGFWGRFVDYLVGLEARDSLDIPLRADYQRTALRAFLEDIAARYDDPGGRARYDTQTLLIYPGETGFQIDIDAAMTQIDAALRRPDERTVELPVGVGEFSQPTLSLLRQLILAYLDSVGFIYDGQSSVASVYIQDLTTGEEINILSDVAFTAASTTKVPILIDYFRALDGDPTQDDAWLMANSLLCSQNSTSNLIMRNILGGGNQFTGIESVTTIAQYVGAENTFLTAPYVDGSANQELGSNPAPPTSPNPNFSTGADIYNQTTAEDLGTLFSMIYDCAYHESGLMVAYPGEFSANECRQMLELMSALDLQRLLQGGIPQGVRISHKNGWFGETAGNAGVVFPSNGRDYVISVFLWEDTGDTNFQDYVRLWPIIEGISRATWNYFAPDDQALRQRRTDLPPSAQECFTTDAAGNRTNVYLPPYGEVDLNNINGWRDGSATLPQPDIAPTALPQQTAPTQPAAPTSVPTRSPLQPTLTPIFQPPR